jgi:hypothetical protein
VQDLIVALIVMTCFVYSVWVLLPAALQYRVARYVLTWPWPDHIARMLKRTINHSASKKSCRCDGCDHNKHAPAATGQPITLHRRFPS